MGSKSSSILQHEQISMMCSKTGFSPSQIEKLHSRFTQLDKLNKGYLTREDLMSIPQLSMNPIGERLVNVFYNSNSSPSTGGIDFMNFIKTLSVFSFYQGNARMLDSTNENVINKVSTDTNQHSNNTGMISNQNSNESSSSDSWDNKYQLPNLAMDNKYRARLLFVFKLYDQDNDGRIGFVDLRSQIKNLIGNCMDETQLDRIALRAFVEVDEDNDGFIDFQEFCKVFEGQDLDNKLRVKFFY